MGSNITGILVISTALNTIKNHASQIADVAKVIDCGLSFRGIRGESALMNLVNIDIV